MVFWGLKTQLQKTKVKAQAAQHSPASGASEATSGKSWPAGGGGAALAEVNKLESFYPKSFSPVMKESRKAPKVSFTFFQCCSRRSLYAKA